MKNKGVKYYGETKQVPTEGNGISGTKVSHGYGSIHWPDGSYYEGNWDNGEKSGFGK
jgi:hypothetical protein